MLILKRTSYCLCLASSIVSDQSNVVIWSRDILQWGGERSVVVLLAFCAINSDFVQSTELLNSADMDQSVEVPSVEVVSLMENDLYKFVSFERFHGHAVLHNTPCRHFAGRVTELLFCCNNLMLRSFGLVNSLSRPFEKSSACNVCLSCSGNTRCRAASTTLFMHNKSV